MKLNLDCMRDILIRMENASYLEKISINQVYEFLSIYEEDDIDYSIIKLKEAGFIEADIRVYPLGVRVFQLDDITFRGHQFLADIQSDSIWDSVKEVSKNIGSNSLHALSQIAITTISSVIKNQLGL